MTIYDKFMAALTIWREARGESQQARNGVYHVILNRAAQSPKEGWPPQVHAVCTQPWQFSSFNKGDPNSVLWPLEKGAADWKAWEEIGQMVDSPLLADPTSGANFYHDVSIEPPFKQWLGPDATIDDLMAKHTADIGKLRFYCL